MGTNESACQVDTRNWILGVLLRTLAVFFSRYKYFLCPRIRILSFLAKNACSYVTRFWTVREMFHVFEHFFGELFKNIFQIWTEHFSRQVFSSKIEDKTCVGFISSSNAPRTKRRRQISFIPQLFEHHFSAQMFKFNFSELNQSREIVRQRKNFWTWTFLKKVFC